MTDREFLEEMERRLGDMVDKLRSRDKRTEERKAGWEDVTAGCHEGRATPETDRGSIIYRDVSNVSTDIFNKYQIQNYRVRKIDLTYESCNHTHAFVIERRKS